MFKKPDLRVLSGKFKGQKITSPQSKLTHPMGSREKLALFNMLQPYLGGAKVLDIYAGSGALGIEALSRGANEVIFVEKSPQIAQILKQNLQQIAGKGHLEAVPRVLTSESHDTALQENLTNSAKNPTLYQIFTESARDFAQNPAYLGYFDLIVADPPYDSFELSEVALLPKLLQNNGILALSFPFKTGTPKFTGLELITVRKYAAAGIAIYRKTSYNI